MIPDGEYPAVVDRIEDGLAALEVDTGEGLDELIVERDELPSQAQETDSVLTIQVREGELIEASFDPGETERRKERAQSRAGWLPRRPPEESGAEESG